MKKEKASLVMDYSQYAAMEDLHRHSKRWLSEIAFRKEEFGFMQKLLNKHFLYFIDSKRIGKTTKLAEQIKSLEQQRSELESSILEHEKHLKQLLQVPGKKQEKDYRTEHRNLEDQLDVFLQDSKQIKQALFSVADEVLKEEKMLHLTQ